jgi:peptide/nickel transport system substrate-binding protein
MRRVFFAVGLASLLALAASASVLASARDAEEAVIGLQVGPTSIDPHFTISTPNQMTALNLFDPLMLRDENMRLVPGLATAWYRVDDHTWEFKLREGVRFHDGSEFTAEDVAFTMRRVPTVPNSPASFAGSVADVVGVEIVDPMTLRVRTRSPFPLFPDEISRLYIVSHRAAEGASTQDFNSGEAAVGTGPYRFVSYAPGERLVLARNDGYWGRKPDFAKVTFRVIGNDASRVAALLSGTVDLIDIVPVSDRERLASDPRVRLWEAASARLMYLHMDQTRAQTPFITDKEGNPLASNPLLDRRVRLALSKLINREALVERVMFGAGEPAGQLVPEGIFGHAPDLESEAYDPAGARQLLAEAGYPEGFRLTIHGPNNRYINDGQVALTVAQMLARGGIDMRVSIMPSNVFFQRAGNQEFSLILVGFGSSSGDAFRGLRAVMASWDPEEGMGSNNRGRYSNPRFDALVREILGEPDETRREQLTQEAARLGFGDVAIIPLYYQVNMWATRPGFRYVARRDERTVAGNLRRDP